MDPVTATCDCDIYIKAIYGLIGVIGALFGWLMKAKSEHYQDLRESISEYRKRTEGTT